MLTRPIQRAENVSEQSIEYEYHSSDHDCFRVMADVNGSAIKKPRSKQWEPSLVFDDLDWNHLSKPIHNTVKRFHRDLGTVRKDGLPFPPTSQAPTC